MVAENYKYRHHCKLAAQVAQDNENNKVVIMICAKSLIEILCRVAEWLIDTHRNNTVITPPTIAPFLSLIIREA